MDPLAGTDVPTLVSRSVALRPLRGSDGEWCYQLMCGAAGATWRYRGRTPPPEVVAADLWRGVFAQFVVERRHDGAPLGLVGLTNVSIESHRAHGFAVGEPSASPLVTEGFGLLCHWAFEQLGFERIYLEAPEFNAARFASLGEAAVVEGRLRNYEHWRGRYWDLLIMALTPESFARRTASLLEARCGAAAEGSLDELRDLVEEIWPPDSLGAVEVLELLEGVVGRPVDVAVLQGTDHLAPTEAMAVLLERAGRVGPDQQPSGPTIGGAESWSSSTVMKSSSSDARVS